MSSKNYLRLFQGGIIASLLIVFFVFSNLLFPYISSKQITFNLLMEFLLPFYLVLMMKAPEYRPRRSWIVYGLSAYFAVILLTCFTGVDFNLSFWGNTERMLGFFHVFHFLLLFLYIVSAFRDAKSWSTLFMCSVGVATIESLLVLSKVAYGTIGNTAYVSGYLIFNIYFAAMLFVRAKDKNLRWLWFLPVVIMFFAFNKANTSGAIIGLGISILAVVFLIGLFSKAQKIRRASLAVFGVAVLGVIILASQWQQPWFQNNPRLHNLTSKKSTFQTRLVSWEGAAKDFKNHPWLGVGFGNYADVFDRQFNARFYNYSRGETYFDRAHNNVIDITSTTGVVGLLAYLSIFVFAVRELWLTLKAGGKRVGWDHQGRKNIELILMFCLLLAYFIQNLAVFDSLVTYFNLMVLLGLIVFHYSSLSPEEPNTKSRFSLAQERASLIGLGIFVLILANYGNLMPYRIFSQTINAYSTFNSGNIWGAYQLYAENFQVPHPLARDCKSTFVRLVSSNSQAIFALPGKQGAEILDYAVKLSEENLAENPKDSLKNLEFAQLADIVSRFYGNNSSLRIEYQKKSIAAVNQSIASSPDRAAVYFIKGQILANQGDIAGAEQVIRQGIALNPNYPEGYCRLSAIYVFAKKPAEAKSFFDQCAALDGLEYATVPNFLVNAASSSVAAGDYPQAIKYVQRLSVLLPGDYNLFINLARLYEHEGRHQEAITAAKRVAELNPKMAADASMYVQQLERKLETSTE